MQAELALATVTKITFQAKSHTTKCQLIPGDVCFVKQDGFQTFDAGLVGFINQTAPVKQMDLTDVGNINQGKQVFSPDVSAGFFLSFP